MRSLSIGSSVQQKSRQISNILLGNSFCFIFVTVALFNFVSTINALSLESNLINEHLQDNQPYSLSHQANDINYDTSFDVEDDDQIDANAPSNDNLGIEVQPAIAKKDAYNPLTASRYSDENSPGNFSPEQLKSFLSKFYLIKTKHGYVLGRNGQSKRSSIKPSRDLLSKYYLIKTKNGYMLGERPEISQAMEASKRSTNSAIFEWKNMPSYRGLNLAKYPMLGDDMASRSNRGQMKWWWW